MPMRVSERKVHKGMVTTQIECPFLTYEEAEQYTGVNRVTLWRGVRAGRLRAAGPGSAVRFRRSELDRWMDARGASPDSSPDAG